MDQIAYNAVAALLAVLGIAYLLFWRYKELRVDWFRQELFSLRDELFDEVEKGLLNFNHPAYGLLRGTMNGFIRFGHRMTVWDIFFLYVLHHKTDDTGVSFLSSWEDATGTLDDETKKRLSFYRHRMEIAALKQVILGTPEAFLFLIPLGIVWLFAGLIVKTVAAVFSRGQRMVDLWDAIRQRQINNIDDTALMYDRSIGPLESA